MKCLLPIVIFALALSAGALSAGCGNDTEPTYIERADPTITDEQQDAMYDGDY